MLNPQLPYIIPFTGLGEGVHHYNFEVGRDFFDSIKDSLVSDGKVTARLAFDKRPNMMLLTFEYDGVLQVTCDRCADEFDQAVQGSSEYIVKFSDHNHEEEDIIYIVRSDINLNVAHYLYESMLLELPLRNVHPNDACNPDVVKNITGESDLHTIYEEAENENDTVSAPEKLIDENNPFAKAFGKIK